MHGGRPSSEYAKIRKESLETQFGRILGSSSRTLGFGPFLALYRAATISFHVLKLTFWHLLLSDVHKRAEKVVFLVPLCLLFLYILFLLVEELSVISVVAILFISVQRDLDTFGAFLHQGRRSLRCDMT